MAEYGFGSGVLYGTRTDIVNPTPRRFGVVQDVTIDISRDLKELYGQSQFPVDVAAGKGKVQVKAKFAQISGLVYNDLFFGQALGTSTTQLAYQEAHTAVSSTFTVTNPTGFVDQGVRYAATGLPLVLYASAPSVGGYSVSGAGVYTFNVADATTAFIVDYTYTVVTSGESFTLANPLMGFAPRFSAVFNMQYGSKQFTLNFLQCASTKLSIPTKLDDFVINEVDFSVYANAAGNILSMSVQDVG